jgi:NAD(P)-dependent dehydrogenase (short-subunit alcohol dehydrogenase family)
MDDLAFKGKTALISGAGSGIGLELAIELGRQGATIIGTDLDQQRVAAMEKTVKGMGITAFGYRVDHADPDDVKVFSEKVLTDHGAVDILCCNAGVGHGRPIEQIPLEDWKWVMDINLYGAVYLIHYFLPSLIERRQGHILITASGAGLMPIAGMAPYCMSKSAMVVMANVLRMELKRYNIKVSALCPGIIDTAIVKDGRMGNERAQSAAEKFYAQRGVTPDVVARGAVKGLKKNKAVIQVPIYHTAGLYVMFRLFPGLILWLGSFLRKRGWSFLGPFLKE